MRAVGFPDRLLDDSPPRVVILSERSESKNLPLNISSMQPGTSKLHRLVILAAVLLVYASTATAQQRFPRPEFDTDYQTPSTTVPGPTSQLMEVVDVAVLAAALGLAAYLALGRRSRRGLSWLSVFSVVYFGFVREGCVCPVGSLQNVAKALADPGFALPATVVAIFLMPLVFALFFGRVFCSGVCPLGSLQELVILRPVKVPEPLDQALGLLRHVVLGSAVLLAVAGSFFLLCRYDPFVPFFRLDGSAGIFAFGGALLLLGTVVARPYCRYLCPYGVLLGWMARFATKRLVTFPEECVDCRLCEPACPVGAIRTATPEALPEERGRAMRRLAITLALLPVVVIAAAWAGSSLDELMARTHPTVRLADRLAMEQSGEVSGTTLESRTYRTSGKSFEELAGRGQAIRARFATGTWWLGAFLGLVVMLKLVALSVWRSRSGSEPEPGACVSCGRCFLSCPEEKQRLVTLQLEDAA